eukprot:COSAG02_NODE_11999_length_1616_cov_9.041529_1_plen_27_part_10
MRFGVGGMTHAPFQHMVMLFNFIHDPQ